MMEWYSGIDKVSALFLTESNAYATRNMTESLNVVTLFLHLESLHGSPLTTQLVTS